MDVINDTNNIINNNVINDTNNITNNNVINNTNNIDNTMNNIIYSIDNKYAIYNNEIYSVNEEYKSLKQILSQYCDNIPSLINYVNFMYNDNLDIKKYALKYENSIKQRNTIISATYNKHFNTTIKIWSLV